mmetsp:Transcript_13823/g.28341  ORF Transcript_13823/g.28341 Transcript_13823/m.28341 type:complete len:424 (-) Transcript_13823:195-1466(-)
MSYSLARMYAEGASGSVKLSGAPSDRREVCSSSSSSSSWDSLATSGTPWRKRNREHSSTPNHNVNENVDSRNAERDSCGGYGQLENKKKPSHFVSERRRGQSAGKEAMDYEKLSDEQKNVMKMVCDDGKSLFFTGAAGSGKSFLLKAIVQRFVELGKKDQTFVTGTTGIASCNVGGVTIHSFSGCGLGDEPLEAMVNRVLHSPHAKKRWRQCKTLVVDEISMLDGRFFEKLAVVGARARDDPRPFGGIQLVLCGDFFQLPPVGIDRQGAPATSTSAAAGSGLRGAASSCCSFCFEAPVWPFAVPHCVVLTSAFRQGDARFVALLNDVRTGDPSEATLSILRDKAAQSKAAQSKAAQSRASASASSSSTSSSTWRCRRSHQGLRCFLSRQLLPCCCAVRAQKPTQTPMAMTRAAAAAAVRRRLV